MERKKLEGTSRVRWGDFHLLASLHSATVLSCFFSHDKAGYVSCIDGNNIGKSLDIPPGKLQFTRLRIITFKVHEFEGKKLSHGKWNDMTSKKECHQLITQRTPLHRLLTSYESYQNVWFLFPWDFTIKFENEHCE